MIIDISKGKQSQHKEIEGDNIMNNTSCRNTVKISMSAALLLTVIMICCTCMTSECEAADRTCNAENEYFDGFEKTYISRIRSYLSDNGYYNSGVTMTSVSDSAGRHYLVEVHNDRFEIIDRSKKTELEKELGGFEFDGGDECSTDFSYTLY